MAGRPKIQFSSDADGDRAWELIELITERRHAQDVKEFEDRLKEIQLDYPEATIRTHFAKPSAGKLILMLLEEELERIAR